MALNKLPDSHGCDPTVVLPKVDGGISWHSLVRRFGPNWPWQRSSQGSIIALRAESSSIEAAESFKCTQIYNLEALSTGSLE